MGSSPRVRGSRFDSSPTVKKYGIIPAGAGLTRTPPNFLTVSQGSSPRVRGSQIVSCHAHLDCGIIPAGAGLTNIRVSCTCTHRDHPRGCGAHTTVRPIDILRQGSSPRVRGSHGEIVNTFHTYGIIPAGAGLTGNVPPRKTQIGDHPRGCGAHTKKSQQLRHFPVLWLPESFTFKHSYRILHLVYSFVSAAT